MAARAYYGIPGVSLNLSEWLLSSPKRLLGQLVAVLSQVVVKVFLTG